MIRAKKNNLSQKQIISKLKRMGYVKNNTLKIRLDSSNASIRAGDLVITFEVHRIVERYKHDKEMFSCIEVLPAPQYQDETGFGCHPRVMHSGPGQQGITKLLKWRKMK